MEMSRATKLIVVNASIGAGLVIALFRGSGLQPTLIAGVLLFVLANLVMRSKGKAR